MDGIAKKKAVKVRNPLEPLATFNWMVLAILGLAVLWDVVGSVIGRGGLLGWGRGDVCVTSDSLGATADPASWLLHPHTGVKTMETGYRLCSDTPTAVQRWWYSLEQLPGTVTLLTVVLMTYLALRQAERFGLYAPGIATRLRILGWFLVAESVLRQPIEAFAARRLWATLADGPIERIWNVGWATLFAGIALLSLARIMGVGSKMREDLEGVV